MSTSLVFGQVGINATSPAATLDVVGKPTVTSVFDGIIPPRITGDQLGSKTYTSAQIGAIVYVTVASTTPAGQTVNVASPGIYIFDGNVWAKSLTKTLPTSQLIMLGRGSGTQLNTASPMTSNARLVYFSNSPVVGGTTDIMNDPGSWNTTTQSYTAPRAGTYQIVATVLLSTCTGAVDGASAYIRTILKPGTGAAAYVINTADVRYTNGYVNSNQYTTVNLQTGDQIFFDYSVAGAVYCSGSVSAIQRISIYRFE